MNLTLADLGPVIKKLQTDISELKQKVSEKPIRKSGGMELWQEITGLSKATFYQYKCMGKIPKNVFRKVGSRFVFNRYELQHWNDNGRPTPAQIVAEA